MSNLEGSILETSKLQFEATWNSIVLGTDYHNIANYLTNEYYQVIMIRAISKDLFWNCIACLIPLALTGDNKDNTSFKELIS